MTISSNDWGAYVSKLRKLSDTAANKLQDYINKNGIENTEAIIEYAYALVTKYGEGSAELACQMYDAIAEAEGVIVQSAVPAATASYPEIARAINGSLLQSPAGNVISSIADRYVKMAAADTTLQNAQRDGAYWAWVPSGDTCAFCITLASRGWQRAGKRILKGGHADHIHAHCDCQFAISLNGKGNVAGYDPDKYLKMYRDAEGNSSKEKVNSLRRELELSRKHRVFEHENSIVDMDYIKSNEFRKKLNSITESANERRGIENSIKEALDHRSGTYFEDLAYVNSKNGEYIINKEFDYYDEEKRISACKPNHSMNVLLRESEDYSIIGVHNHPKSNAPSIMDIKYAYERQYKYGIVSCHNGSVYKYTVDKTFENTKKNRRYCDMLLEDLDKAVYTKDEKKIEQALVILANNGIKIEVV